MTKKERDIQIALGIKHQYFIQWLETNGYYNIDTTDAVDEDEAIELADSIFGFTERDMVYGEHWKVKLIEN